MTDTEIFEQAKTAAQMEAALSSWRDGAFSALVCTALELVARQRPQELRKALAEVFDIAPTEERYERLYLLLTSLSVEAEECRDKLYQAQKRIEALEKRLEAVEYETPQVRK